MSMERKPHYVRSVFVGPSLSPRVDEYLQATGSTWSLMVKTGLERVLDDYWSGKSDHTTNRKAK